MKIKNRRAEWSVNEKNEFAEIRKSTPVPYTLQDYEDFKKQRAEAIEFYRQMHEKLKVSFGNDYDSKERRFYFQRLPDEGKLPSDNPETYPAHYGYAQWRIYPMLHKERWQKWEDDPIESFHEYPDFDTTGKVYSPEIQHAQYMPSYAVTEQQVPFYHAPSITMQQHEEPCYVVQQHEGPAYSVAEQQQEPSYHSAMQQHEASYTVQWHTPAVRRHESSYSAPSYTTAEQQYYTMPISNFHTPPPSSQSLLITLPWCTKMIKKWQL